MVIKSRKELEIILSRVPSFPTPKRELEQYVCDSRIASELLWSAFMAGDIEGKVVADLGCGTGVLSYGALALGASQALCIDIDCEAIYIAKNFIDLETRLIEGNAHFVCADVRKLGVRKADTVVMNPPFGVYSPGIDMEFLISALNLKPYAIYSIHKHSDQLLHVIQRILKQYGDEYIIASITINNMAIPQIFETHRRRIHRFKVAIVKIKQS